MRSLLKATSFALVACLLVCCCQQSDSSRTSRDISFSEAVVVGGPDDFMEVRHVVLKGSNYAIGRKIAEIARENNVQSGPSGDRLRNQVQREYIARNYPILYERMKGVADTYGLDIEDNTCDFSGLSQYPSSIPGCSAVFYPGAFTESGHSVLSRNYDFTTGTFQGKRPQEGEMAVMSRPYIFEIYPDDGYASLSLCAFDLLGGVLDGINSEGLVVAVLADGETMMKFGVNPTAGIGMHELLSLRYLLDNCGDVEEAKETLLYLKHYYSFMPCHYMIADRNGDSFVFEFSSIRNGTAIVDGQGPQCITNHLLSNYQSIGEFPEEGRTDSYDRFRKLHNSMTAKETFSIDEIRAINSSVAATDVALDHPDYAPGRTLWHALYDIENRSMSVKFYLGEKTDPSDNEKTVIEYSDYLTVQLRN